MERIILPGRKIQIAEHLFSIQSIIGDGASCVVYLAEKDDGTLHMLKEYNPMRLELYREDNGVLCLESNDDIEHYKFVEGLNRFLTGAENQKHIRRSFDELTNSTTNVQDIYYANGTAYIDMTVFRGQSYEKLREQSLYDLFRRMKALVNVIGNYHKNGYLHLDIKPENIFTIPETCEMVMLFDFDSVIKKDALSGALSLSYTKTWGAPELLRMDYRRISEATDLFSVGEIIFYKIFGRHSETGERRSFATYSYNYESDMCKNVNPKLFPILTDLLRHTICTSPSNRYQSTDELMEMLDKLIPLSDPKEPFLVSSRVIPEAFFIGREHELIDVHEKLQTDHILFLCGMGGIGKSELAKNYVIRYKDDYDTVFFATYTGSWLTLVIDDLSVQIANFARLQQEKEEDYYHRKLAKLRELCDRRTLFLIDNVNEDEFSEEETEYFRRLLELGCCFLFTSRLRDWNYPSRDVEALEKRNDRIALFCNWCPVKDETQLVAVNEIIDYVGAHTLTTELIAKQTCAGFSSPKRMLQKLKERGVRDSGKEKVHSDKDNVTARKTPFDHICDLYDMANLTDTQKYVLFNMALISAVGIDGSLFMEWCEIGDADDINTLISFGWLNREGVRIKMHPVVAEAVLGMLPNTTVFNTLIGHINELLPDRSESLDGKLETIDCSVLTKYKDLFVSIINCAKKNRFTSSEFLLLLYNIGSWYEDYTFDFHLTEKIWDALLYLEIEGKADLALYKWKLVQHLTMLIAHENILGTNDYRANKIKEIRRILSTAFEPSISTSYKNKDIDYLADLLSFHLVDNDAALQQLQSDIISLYESMKATKEVNISPDVLLSVADAFYCRGRFKESNSILLELSKCCNLDIIQSFETNFKLAGNYILLKEYQNAIHYYRIAIELANQAWPYDIYSQLNAKIGLFIALLLSDEEDAFLQNPDELLKLSREITDGIFGSCDVDELCLKEGEFYSYLMASATWFRALALWKAENGMQITDNEVIIKLLNESNEIFKSLKESEEINENNHYLQMLSVHCRNCPYYHDNNHFPPIKYEINRASTLLVFQAPGSDEWSGNGGATERVPVISLNKHSAASRMRNSFKRKGVERNDYDFAEVVLCYPGKSNKRDRIPLKNSIRCCSKHLKALINLNNYKEIVAFGKMADKALTDIGIVHRKAKHPSSRVSNAELDKSY